MLPDAEVERLVKRVRHEALEEAAQIMDRWVSECDPKDYDGMLMADCYRHAAEQIRLLKRAERDEA